MADYSVLKAVIDAAIKRNLAQQISGPVLNTVLNSMVSSLGVGYQYGGIVYPTSHLSPTDENFFYIAYTAGNYPTPEFTLESGQLAIIAWDGSWSVDIIVLGTAATIAEIDALFNNGGNYLRLYNEGAPDYEARVEVGENYDSSTTEDGGLTVFVNPPDIYDENWRPIYPIGYEMYVDEGNIVVDTETSPFIIETVSSPETWGIV